MNKGALCAGLLAFPALAATVLRSEVQLSAEERYDDDALLRVGGAGQLITKVSPQAGLKVANPNLEARGFYAADFLWHHGSGGLTIDHRGGLSSFNRLSHRADLKLDARFWRVTDPTSLPRLGLSYVLQPMRYGRLDLGLRGDATERFETRAGYRFEGVQIEEAGRPLGLYHAPTAEASYRLTRRSAMGIEGRYQLFTLWPERAMAAGGFLTFRHRVSYLTTFVARAGPIWYRGGDGADGFSPRIGAELTHETEGFDLNLSAGQDLAGATGFDAAVRAQYLSAVLGVRLSRPLRLYAAAHGFRNGPAVAADQGVLLRASSQGYGAGLGLEWRLSRQVSLSATANRFAEAAGDRLAAVAERNIIAVRLVLTAF